ncbi:hypothetical protein Taro_017418 [Colocasia esculenta]|uniref:Uncharacterized protein n=1 Tax=Colocasia esculenta TaxID=4460 RepID=A0A843UN23_COLES|nr:hypothetical protein [Colocasia esculenta]
MGLQLCVRKSVLGEFPTEPVTREAHPYPPQVRARRTFRYRRPVRSRVATVLGQRLQQCSDEFTPPHHRVPGLGEFTPPHPRAPGPVPEDVVSLQEGGGSFYDSTLREVWINGHSQVSIPPQAAPSTSARAPHVPSSGGMGGDEHEDEDS